MMIQLSVMWRLFDVVWSSLYFLIWGECCYGCSNSIHVIVHGCAHIVYTIIILIAHLGKWEVHCFVNIVG